MAGEDSDGAFEWYATCPNQHGLAPAATVNISAQVMMRIYVCPMDGYTVIRTSEGERSVYAPTFFMDRLDENRQRLSTQAKLERSGGDGG